MIRTAAIAVLMVASATVSPRADDIYRLIQEGKYEAARQELSRVSTASRRDGTHLFFQALLEPNGPRAAELMEVALESSVDLEYRELINYRLAEYYYLSGNWERLEQSIVSHRAKFENGRYAPQMARLSVLLDEREGQYDAALQQIDRYLLAHGAADNKQWGQIDKARLLYRHKKGVGADRLLRGLSREKAGPGVPIALYLMTLDAVNGRRADDAVYFYNVLRDVYPGAVGQDALVDRMAEMAGGVEKRGAEADEITGTFYSIQAGVFSDAANARTLADQLKRAGHRVEIVDKTISRTKYKVVYVGRYRTWSEAEAAKSKLDGKQKETYQVIAR